MKKPIIAAIAAASVLGAGAKGTATLQNVEFETDTLAHYSIGPGITHTHLQLRTPSGSRQIQVFISTLDRSNPDHAALTAPRVEIGKDQCRTAESVTSMAKRKTGGDRQYLAGINGDFFITSSFAAQHEFGNAILGYPNMSCVIDGKIAAPDMIDITSRENALIIARDGWWIDATDLTYKLLNNDGSVTVRAKAVNYPRRGNELMVYNSYMGATTGTGLDGREIALVPAEGATWRVNNSVKFVVKGDWGKGDTAIPADGIVISCGPDYHNEWIDGLKDGDIVKLKINLSLPAHENLKPKATDIIGGDVRILNRNVTTTEAIRWINTPGAQYPRSLVGFDESRTRMMMVAVDGGNTVSSGVSYYEAADLMRALGCYDALDLDGGGSTAMYLEHAGIVNHPRDGNERAVGNALYFVLDAPVDKTVTSISFADHAKVLPHFGSYTPVIYGYNRYGQLVDTDVKGAVLSAPEGLGTVSADGATLLASGEGCHALAATCGGMSASIAVSVDATFTAQPVYTDMLIDNTRDYPLLLQAAVGGEMMPVAPYAYTWAPADAGIMTIDAEGGTIRGEKDGVTTLTGRIGDDGEPVAINVTVECPKALEADIEDTHDASSWRVSRTSVSTATLSDDAEGGYVLDYKVTSSRGSRVALNKDVRLWSVPDAVDVHFNTGGTALKSVTVSLRAANQTRAKTLEVTDIKADADNVARFELSGLGDTSDPGMYPVTLTAVAFNHGGGTGTFKVKVPAIKAVYSRYTGAGVDNVSADRGTGLGMKVRVEGGQAVLPTVAGSVKVYSASGALVAAASGTDRVTLPAAHGIYVVQAEIGGTTAVAKIAY